MIIWVEGWPRCEIVEGTLRGKGHLRYPEPMFVTIALRFREQQIISTVMNRFLSEGWNFRGYLPGPEYTTKAVSNALSFGSSTYVMGAVEKDQWFMLLFDRLDADSIPDGIAEIKISGKEGAFFKANRPVFLGSRINMDPPNSIDEQGALAESGIDSEGQKVKPVHVMGTRIK